jgi:small-conductance mechanosensitive channel
MEDFPGYQYLLQYRALGALLIFAAFALLAKAVDLAVKRLLRKLARTTKTSLDDRLLDFIHRPIFFTVLATGAVRAIAHLGPPDRFAFYINGALYTSLAFIWGIAAVRVSDLLTENSLGKIAGMAGLSKDIIPFVKNVWKVAIVAAALMGVLYIWKLDITPLLASAGIAGVAIALAAKDTLANFLGGISIYIDRPYRIGDYIVLETGERGEVVDIGIRSTRIKTRDDVLITVPNSILSSTKIINESAPYPNFRVRIPVGVAYGSDIEKVERILIEAAAENGNVLEDPSPRARFRKFGDSSLDYELLCWAREPALRGLTVHELNRAIYMKFNASGVVIPFPQRDVHIRAGETIKTSTEETLG